MASFSIRNEVGATVFAVLAGLSALFFTAWLFSPAGEPDETGTLLSPVPGSAAARAAAEKQAAELAEARAQLSQESARRAELAMQLKETREQARTQQERIQALKAELEAAGKAKAQVATLRKELQSREEQIVAGKKAREEEKARLRAQVESWKKKAESGTDEQAATTNKPSTPPAPALPQLDFPLLVNSAANLQPDFAALFEGLGRVDGGPEQRETIYAELKKSGKNSDIHLVPFQVGSSEVVAEEVDVLKKLLTDIPDSTRFFVVGYASTDGDPASNRKLSSERASKVAQKVVDLSGISQENVQAFYFGPTKRFDASNLPPNRVAEVWQVK